jgi:hypothetical protein
MDATETRLEVVDLTHLAQGAGSCEHNNGHSVSIKIHGISLLRMRTISVSRGPLCGLSRLLSRSISCDSTQLVQIRSCGELM